MSGPFYSAMSGPFSAAMAGLFPAAIIDHLFVFPRVVIACPVGVLNIVILIFNYPPSIATMKPVMSRCASTRPSSWGSSQTIPLHFQHGHKTSIRLFSFMSCTADRNHLSTIVPLTIMNVCTVIINKLIIKMCACIKVIQKFGMTFPKK